MISKGIISSIKDKKAVVIPYDAQKIVTFPLSVPVRFSGEQALKTGETVIYVLFEDCTGIILERI